MKKMFFMLVIFLFTIVQVSYAHPPSSVEVNFAPESKQLIISISHKVRNTARHFINKIEVLLNGQQIIVHKVSKQSSSATEKVSYVIPDAMEGDLITVKASCNIAGIRKGEIKVQ